MRRLIVGFALAFVAIPLSAQVQSVGDVSFAVPGGWKYQQGSDFGAMVLTEGQNFWLMAVYTSMPSGGDIVADLQAGWTRIILAGPDYQGMPASHYQISHSLGYSGEYGDDTSLSRLTYTRMYVLKARDRFIPVVTVSRDGVTLNSMQHVALDLISTVRLAPLQAQPIRTTISVADLVGHWTHGAASSYDFYNQQTGRYESTASAFYGAGYTIAADGSFTYQMAGMINGHTTRDEDSGVVQLGQDLVVFKGRNHEVRYRFMNLIQALDGSMVLTLLPDVSDISRLNIIRDRDQWSRAPGK